MTESSAGRVGPRMDAVHDPKAPDPRKIVVKVGTNFVWENGAVKEPEMLWVANQVGKIWESGGQVFMVVSGADARGRKTVEDDIKAGRLESIDESLGDEEATRAQLERHRDNQTVFGQTDLMYDYVDALRSVGVKGGCMFVGSTRLGRWQRRLDNTPASGIIVLNGDSVRMKQNDKLHNNDKVAGLVTTKFTNAGNLAFLTVTGGVLDGNDEVIPWIDAKRRFHNTSLRKVGKSQDGTGGMDEKLDIAREVARRGVRVTITGIDISNPQEEVLVNFYNGQPVNTFVSTHKPK